MGIAARASSKHFGDVRRARRCLDRRAGGLADRAARAERMRQVDAAARDRRARAAGRRRRVLLDGRDVTGLAAAASAASASSSSTTPPSST